MGKIARLCALGALLTPLCAQAFPDLVTGIDAGLTVQREHLDLRSAGIPHETRITRAGIFLWEDYGQWLQLGLEGGGLLVTQSGNPATAGMELSGNYLMLSARSRPWVSERWEAVVGGSYGYHRADDEQGGQTTRFTWHEGRAEAGAVAKLGALRVSGGGFGLWIDGDETGGGATSSLDLDEHAGAFLGVDYWLDPTGHVGLRAEGGARDSLQLSFARRF